MKKLSIFLFAFVVLFVFAGCAEGGKTVKNPPEFVEMHVGEDGDFVTLRDHADNSQGLIRLDETSGAATTDESTTTDAPTTTIPIDVEFEASIFSHTDFEIVIVTTGVNYDLLYSVELVDSVLGTCVYTDQSLLYKANSTIITETDGSYRTEISLTIPGSTEHTEYLSERTIALSKILFTRDTADGTFPADIPSNTTTTLLFEVHARKYFDSVLGLPLFVSDEAKVDIIAMPDTEFFLDVETNGKTELVIPGTINGYPVGKIVLCDLDWVESIEINGGTENVLLLGGLAELVSISISGLERLPLEAYAHLVINGTFPALTSVSLAGIVKYNVFMTADVHDIDGLLSDENYDTYLEDNATTPSTFPELVSISVTDSVLYSLRICNFVVNQPFSKLKSVSISDTVINDFEIGKELNEFPLLETIAITDSQVSSMTISGTMPETATPAAITISNSTLHYSLSVRGSIIGEIAITESELKDIVINEGSIEESKFFGISIASTTFASGGSIQIKGDHPHLLEIEFDTMTMPAGQIIIGSVEAEFAGLTSIVLQDVSAGSLMIGDRDTSFPALEVIHVDHVLLTGDLRIGYEASSYPLLDVISITNVMANNLIVGRHEDDFSGLTLIYLQNLDIEVDISITGGLGYTVLETIVVIDVETTNFGIMAYGNDYDVYIDGLQTTNNPYIADACQTLYVDIANVTEWPYYSYVHDELSITILTGAYVPE